MPGPCPNPWYFGGCESTIPYLWRWTDSWQRWDLYALALMLVYVAVVVVRGMTSLLFRPRREPTGAASSESKLAQEKLLANLIPAAAGLKAVAAGAPYLGLIGTCVGILGMFHGVAMSRSAVLQMEASELGASCLSTPAGLLVAIIATCFHNYFRTRIDALKVEGGRTRRNAGTPRTGTAQTLPLAARYSVPSFAVVAAPVLALSLAGFLTFASLNPKKGLLIRLAPNGCAFDPRQDPTIVLHVANRGQLLINFENVDWNSLAGRLSLIYSLRAEKTIYLLADDEVPFQTVADAIDIIKGATFTNSSTPLGIRVDLITPGAHCPVFARSDLIERGSRLATQNSRLRTTSRSSSKISQ